MLRGRGFPGTEGAVAVELAIATPFLLLLIAGVIDFGNYMNSDQAIAAATRIGAEYARANYLNPASLTCPAGTAGINAAVNPPTISSACIGAPSPPSGIEGAMYSSFAYGSGALTVNTPSVACQCDDGLSITCGLSCAAQIPARSAPNRVFITVSASQTFAPIIPWPGIPASLPVAGSTTLRIQ